jgi:glycosyltransferase involved in cell wall biosynthesis
MFVRYKETDDPTVLEFKPYSSFSSRFRRTFRYAQMRSDFFPRYVSWPHGKMPISDDRSRFSGELIGQVLPSDILHFHWVAEFVDIPYFLERVNIPIVWTLHDMNPFTGGCHYNFGCRGFERSCGCCPKLNSDRENDPSFRSWSRKNNAYRKKIRRKQLHVVAPSEWLAHEVGKSTLLGDAGIHFIPHGLDTTLFRPRNAEHERNRISIPESQKVALFVAHSSTDSRKGFGILSKALAKLHFEDVTLVSIGKNAPTVPEALSHVHAGYVDDDQRLSVLYSMADVFIIPSLQEAFGQTALEAMACATPVIGFDTGGIPDMVRPGDTGWLAKTGSIRELRQAIEAALDNDDKRRRMGRRCRDVVKKEYTIKRQAKRYKSLYESIIS